MTGVQVVIVDEAATAGLRRAVLRPQLPADDPTPAFGPAGALHLGAMDAHGAVVGTCAIFPAPHPSNPRRPHTWQLRGMATDPTVRGTGVGTAVLAAAEQQAREHEATLLWCNARVSAVGFYERHGWVVESEVFRGGESGLPHRQMSRELRPPPASSP